MKIFLTLVKDNQIKIIFKEELDISIKQIITFFIIGQYKTKFNIQSFVGVWTCISMRLSPYQKMQEPDEGRIRKWTKDRLETR
jgi:hypothetical protein